MYTHTCTYIPYACTHYDSVTLLKVSKTLDKFLSELQEGVFDQEPPKTKVGHLLQCCVGVRHSLSSF